MATYRAVYRQPVTFQHTDKSGQEYVIEGAAPPFTGTVAHAQIFQMTQHLEKSAFGEIGSGKHLEKIDARSLGFFLDAQNAAYADRNRYVADPDFVDVPTMELISKSYVADRIEQLWGNTYNNNTALSVPVPPGNPFGASNNAPSFSEDDGTAHTTIIDRAGNVVVLTTTANSKLGAKVVVQGTGILLNNELCDFDDLGFDSEGNLKVNAAEGGKRPRRTALHGDSGSMGGKRPRSSMSPTIITPVGSLIIAPFTVMGIGAPGSSDILGGVANVMRHALRSDRFDPFELQQAIDAPRVLGKNKASEGSGTAEIGLMSDSALMDALIGWGYNISTYSSRPPYVNPVGRSFGRVNSAVMLGSPNYPVFVGAADSLRMPACRAVAP